MRTQTDNPVEKKYPSRHSLHSPTGLVVMMLTCFFKKAWLFPSLCLFLIVFYSHCSPGRKPSYCFSLQQMLSSCRNLSAAEPILLGADFYRRWGGVMGGGGGWGGLHIHIFTAQFTYSVAEKVKS